MHGGLLSKRGQLDGVTGFCLAVAVGTTLSPGIVVTRFYALQGNNSAVLQSILPCLEFLVNITTARPPGK